MKRFTWAVRFMLLAIALQISICSFAQEAKKSHCDSLGIVPDFRFYNLKGELFTKDSLKAGKSNTVIIYFKTSCEFCLSEFKLIKHNMGQFPNAQFVLVSREDISELKKYDSARQFSYYPQIHVVSDKESLYRTYYQAYYTPSIHIYDEKMSLIRFSDGMISKEELLRLLKE